MSVECIDVDDSPSPEDREVHLPCDPNDLRHNLSRRRHVRTVSDARCACT